MASDLDCVNYVIGPIADESGISFKKIFGEYALYSNHKVVALICDNQQLVKPTDAGKQYIEDYIEVCAYPGAKPSLLIEDQLEDSAWLSRLMLITEQALAPPKSKSKKRKNYHKEHLKPTMIVFATAQLTT